ncbi:MAG: AMP-binding protein [Marivita sp.]
MNIDKIIIHLARTDEGNPLFADLAGRSLSAPSFANRVRQMVSGLRRLGLKPGAKVALLALNSIEYAETICGTICAGMVTVPLNIRWSPKELAFAIEDAGVEALIVDDNFLPTVPTIQSLTRQIKIVAHIGLADTPHSAVKYEELFDSYADLDPDRNPATECLISYTGGTTGFPKGVVHTHASLLASAGNMAINGTPSKGATYLIGVPMFHISGFGFLFARLLQNETLAIVPLFRPDLVIAAVKSLKVDEIGLVPTMLQMLMADPDFDAKDFQNIKRIYYGASPITEALLTQVMDAFKGAEMVQLYGMTEVGVICFLGPQFHCGPLARLAAAGQEGPLARIQIEDENGNEVANGEAGEVVIYGTSVMARYHDRPEQTEEAIRNGGLRSGDVGYKDELGVIFLLDRVKDMIVSGGENVYSAEVENAIASHPDVALVAVIAIPDEKFGEAVHAVIVAKNGREPTFESIREHAKEMISGYKCPRSIELIDEMPLSAMNKVLKTELRKPHWKSIGDIKR